MPPKSSRPTAAPKPKARAAKSTTTTTTKPKSTTTPTGSRSNSRAPSAAPATPKAKKDTPLYISHTGKQDVLSAASLKAKQELAQAELERKAAEQKEIYKEEFRKTHRFKSHYSVGVPLVSFVRKNEDCVIAVQKSIEDVVGDVLKIGEGVLRGKEKLRVGGRTFEARTELVTEEFLRHIPKEVWKNASGKKPNRLIRFEEVVELPPLPSEDQLRAKRIKAHISQPKGMMMRYKPFGTNDDTIEEIMAPSSDESSGEELFATTDSKKRKKADLVVRREKRRAEEMDVDEDSAKKVRFGEGEEKERKDKKRKERKERKEGKEKKDKKDKKDKSPKKKAST